MTLSNYCDHGAEIAALQAKLVESQREKEARFDCHAGPGTTLPACGACVTCLLREVETLQAKLEAAERERDEVYQGFKEMSELAARNFDAIYSAHEDVRALALAASGVLSNSETKLSCVKLDRLYEILARPSVRKIVEAT